MRTLRNVRNPVKQGTPGVSKSLKGERFLALLSDRPWVRIPPGSPDDHAALDTSCVAFLFRQSTDGIEKSSSLGFVVSARWLRATPERVLYCRKDDSPCTMVGAVSPRLAGVCNAMISDRCAGIVLLFLCCPRYIASPQSSSRTRRIAPCSPGKSVIQ